MATLRADESRIRARGGQGAFQLLGRIIEMGEMERGSCSPGLETSPNSCRIAKEGSDDSRRS